MYKKEFKTGTFYHGDCLEVFKELKTEEFDLAVIDPPYTMTKFGKSCRPNYMEYSEDNLFDLPLPNLKLWLKNSFETLKSPSHFYVFCNKNDIVKFINEAENQGFKLHNIITMIKDTKMPNRWYLKYTEFILFFRKGKAFPINDMTSRDYVDVVMPKTSNGKIHITQKPLNLIEKLITNSSKEGEIVFDPFAGSGTTAVAALKNKRKWVCIEVDKTYFDLACERILEAEKNV